MIFIDDWRRRKSTAFDLTANSTARRVIPFTLWGKPTQIYANANLSIYSAQRCNARCPFCVEELRPASRGVELAFQREIENDDARYFEKMEETLTALKPLSLSISVTGGEPSKDPRLPRILQTIERQQLRKCTLTTNGSGLLDMREKEHVIDWIAFARFDHLNISVAHPDHDRNAQLMQLREGLTLSQLEEVVGIAAAAGIRCRLSCVLLKSGVCTVNDLCRYVDFAQSIGVSNVIFRQLMKTDPETHAVGGVVRYSDSQRTMLEPLLDQLSGDPRFTFVRQIMGYYYYVEVWNCRGADVVFEEADLSQLEKVKCSDPDTIHELIFHPNATLASTWQPWDGVLGPPDLAAVSISEE